MDYHELRKFRSEIDLAENFFTEFAAREDEILTFGMRKVAKWESYIATSEHLKAFETKIHEFEEFLRPVDKLLYERVRKLLNDSNIVESITGIEVALRIASNKQKLSVPSEVLSGLLLQLPYLANLFRRRKLFSEEVIPIQKLIVSLGRLNNLVAMSESSYIKRWSRDSDVFKPSNLDEEKIIIFIETAISEIEDNSPLSAEDKKQLIEYLYKAKIEFASERPSWNKIVGALVIAAAITSGISDSSGAYENIDKAIKYILGTSIEQYMPAERKLPLLKEPRKIEKEDDFSEFIDV
ncbi:hypothetical protein [Vreelandella nigrificans]|uniref:Uncharacterized protein n=1 Tax=Vreelandella nigrificans TaxID=2042704 RepID=A0A2A4HPV1_9GAMM|nr:hypothetical protein [Halomonas nigrificans]PCF96942.1 hypothetical protein CPA45_04325 [Halomonas nigrificans]